MASGPPPFQVEDTTDEDFFDKLVNDDDDVVFKVTTTSSAYVPLFSSNGNKSDEVKALANLRIDEIDSNGDVNCDNVGTSNHIGIDNRSTKIGKVEQINNLGAPRQSGNPSMLSNYLEFESLIHQSENEDGGTEVLSDTTVVSKSSGEGFSDITVVSKISGESGTPGVKEVGWSAFHADSAKGDGNGFGSYSDFFTELGGEKSDGAFVEVVGHTINNGPDVSIGNDIHRSAYVENFNSFWQYNEGYNNDVATDQSSGAHDLNSSQYWENQYPGWKYDLSTGQWYQVDGYDVSSNMQANVGSNLSSTWGLANELAEVSYLQQTSKSVPGTMAEIGTTESVTNWNQTLEESNGTSPISSDLNQVSQDNNNYPLYMVFDPQYPGWYYDTVAQEWRILESYTTLVQSTPQVQEEMHGGGYASSDTFYQKDDEKTNLTNDQSNSYSTQGFGSQVQDQTWTQSASNYGPQGSSMWQPQNVARRESTPQYIGNQLSEDHHKHNFTVIPHENGQNTTNYKASYYENASQGQNEFSMSSGLLGFPGGNLTQQYNDSKINQNDQKHVLNDYYNNKNSVNFPKQHNQSAQISYTPATGRSSAGRPAHALVAFGFGGKLIVLKDSSSTENFNFGGQNNVGGSISILNLAEIANHYSNSSNNVMGVYNYFQALCQQFVPGPLSSGSIGARELNKWIDERIANLADMDYRKAEVLKMLLSLLKIACQYYGKLRSPYGTDTILKENDSPESAVAKLFASTKRNDLQFSQYGVFSKCLQQIPSEEQMQVTATEVQSLLVSGRKKEALQCAQEGQLWGPALVLAAQLGDQFYVETVKQMALHQFVAGSPLRTICLLIVGQPADVFSADNTTISNMVGAINIPQQPAQFGTNGMLDDWKENLAVITANRTKDDELVLMHLGDCLWKQRSDIIAAHICYLVAEASFEPYSDTARMCLVGADHWKYPRTYASPEAIQRTEIYEYSKMLGNSQFVLLSFQPYKLIYAHMLAEVGRISDALKYCQAVIKSLKTGRTTEVETLKHLVSSLEERIKAHQQGGFSTNLAPKKLVGKLLNLFDTTAHRVVGSIPPTVSVASDNAQVNENYQLLGPRVSTSQSTLAMSSLVPSQSSEPISDRTTNSNRMVMHTRSVSEPNFGRSPRQGHTDSLKEASSTNVEDKASTIGGTFGFGSFGFGSQLLQKTVGLVLRPRQGRQAKLGESNKFYYDEKLKRWVEEGVEPPSEEATLPPPPPTTVFQNGTSDYRLKSALQNEVSHTNRSPESKSPKIVDSSSGIPPLPPTSNQYSTRGRMGVRSRYVDTFNKGGGNATNLFQPPSAPSVKPTTGANPKFFVPTPVHIVDHPVEASANDMHDTSTHENHASSTLSDSFHSPTHQCSATMQRFASMADISNQGMSNNGSSSSHSRRTASWSGISNNSFSDPNSADIKPLGEVLGMLPSPIMPSDPSVARSSMSGGGDDPHEVKL
ncbi:protein transport protein SEC16B homolog [Sesamum indicum]|uniref:Protein transport protein sec16 n=1 Tax=Sesamum indicum TaxID=4182 RepID=A0A6I9SL39_SESIN|nr:protein transport protein SEC16B homolog [Sesamum indicum]